APTFFRLLHRPDAFRPRSSRPSPHPPTGGDQWLGRSPLGAELRHVQGRKSRRRTGRGRSGHGRYGEPCWGTVRRQAGGLDRGPAGGARPRCSLLLPAAPEPLSPAGGAGEEAPDDDEDEAEAEDPERPGTVGGARSGGGGGGGGGAGPGSCGGPGGAFTRRAVTLRVLLKDGLLEPGAGVLSIYYLGKKFVGDLQPDGRIVWQETGQVFNSPSAWATHCKKLVNPAKKSGCGWASVKYKGQKLDKYKAAWLRRNQFHVPAAAADESPASEGEEEELLMEEEEEEVLTGVSAEDKIRRPQAKGPSEPVHPGEREAIPPGKRVENKSRVPVRYCMLGSRDSARNPHTLVEVTSFAAINKFQPFNVAISSNVLFLLDFHSHLTRSQVVGYLGGRWDINSQSGYLGSVGKGGVWGWGLCPCLLPPLSSAHRAESLPLSEPAGGRGDRGHSGRGDLPEPAPAGPVSGGLVPQPPAQPRAAIAAGHRRADGLPAAASGLQQWLPTLPRPAVLPLLLWQPGPRVQDLALLGDAAP
uniref:MPN domain containing n=1 Tax=Catagonus wagneri TaxID=51154 RepID=A0A8C3X1I0_9CETA